MLTTVVPTFVLLLLAAVSLSEATCVVSEDHCVRCYTHNVICIECEDGYYPWIGVCKTCLEACVTCARGYSCSKCKTGGWGTACDQTCPVNCRNNTCNQTTGDCSEGCDDGYHGSSCNITFPVNCRNDRCNQTTEDCSEGCDDGFEGLKCSTCMHVIGRESLLFQNNTCPVNCKSDRCDQSSGDCSDGCDDGSMCQDTCPANCKKQDICDETYYLVYPAPALEARLTEEETTTAVPVGGVVGGVLALLGVIVAGIIVLVLLRRRRRQRHKHDSPDNVYVNGAMSSGEMHQKHISDSDPSVVWSTNPDYGSFPALKRPATVLLSEKEEEEETSIVNQSSDPELEPLPESEAIALPASEVVVGKPTRLNNLQKFVREKSNKDFAEEFEKLPQGLLKPHATSRRSENLHKNRYKLLYPYDDNRVVLKEAVGDYINASYIDGYNKPRAYIAAPGPTQATLDDFWEVIWQEEVGTIVMLTRLYEGASGKMKCEQYWPDKGQSVKHGSISVTMETEEEFADFVVRELTAVKDGETRTLRHIQYTSWPDHGVPDDVTSLVEFRQKVKATQSTLSGPTVVHCSAGIGRTGTYIALDYLSEEGEELGAVNIAGCVRRLREQRVNMVQTEAQYVCLHHAVVHSLTLGGENIPGDKFRSNYITVTRPVTGGAPLLRQKFQQLQEILEATPEDDDSVVKNTAFKKKNRKGSPVPGNGHRPFLHLDVSKESSNYINAVFLNSYLSRDALIVTQTPLPATVEDFWTLVVQENSPCIVMMETLDTRDKDIGVYWPSEGVSKKFGKFTIQLTKTEDNDTFVTNTLKIVQKGNEREVTQFRFLGWPLGDKVPESPSSVLQLIGAVEGAARASDCKRPVIIHCLDGAERSGLYCAVFVLTEKMKLEQEVSVINTVRQLKTRRRQLVPNYEQYCYCHLAVNTLLESFKTYSNFILR